MMAAWRLFGLMPRVVLLPTRACVFVANVGTAAVTNAVVAICVVFVPAVAVGAAGTPVKVGEAVGAAPETSATASVTAPVRPATDVTGADVR
jgi:hypothetical protein